MEKQLSRLYSDLEHRLVDLNADMMAAESHGVLCARFCLEDTPDAGSWVREVLGQQEPGNLQAGESEQFLAQVYAQTSASFLEAMDEFEMLLPDDYEALTERTRALADWCSGFVAGLGLGGLQADNLLEGEVGEATQDLIEITRMDDDVEENESNEMAYTEIMEYVRVAVMTIGLSLRNPDHGQVLHS